MMYHGLCTRLPLFVGLLLAGLLLPVGLAMAQPQLAIEPDTVMFSDQETTVDSLWIWNTGSDSLRIDSLRFSTYDPISWRLDIYDSDSTYALDYLGRLEEPSSFPEITLSSMDTILVRLSLRIATGKAHLQDTSPPIVDTLWVYSTDPVQNPWLVFIDGPVYVSTEPSSPPSNQLTLKAYPVPAQQQVTLEVEAQLPGPVQIEVFNVLGRRVYRHTVQAMASGPVRLQWPEDAALAGGLYLVRACTPYMHRTRSIFLLK